MPLRFSGCVHCSNNLVPFDIDFMFCDGQLHCLYADDKSKKGICVGMVFCATIMVSLM